MRFWDSSALLPLHVEQASSAAVRALYAGDPLVLAWMLSDVEVRAALARLGREGAVDGDRIPELVRRAEAFFTTVHFVSLVDAVKTRAKRLIGVHALRAADAMQLGAALAAAADDPGGWGFVCLDLRLARAAQREGFDILP